MDKTKYITIENASERIGISTDDFKKHIIMWMQDIVRENKLLQEENEKIKDVNEKIRESLSVTPNPDGFIDIPETIFNLRGLSTRARNCLRYRCSRDHENLLVFTKLSERAALHHFRNLGKGTLQEIRKKMELYGLEFDNPYSVFKIKNPLNEPCHRFSFAEIEEMLGIEGVIYKS